MRPGYAIEYDFVHPTQLAPTLECSRRARSLPGRPDQRQRPLRRSGGARPVGGCDAAAAVLGREPFLPIARSATWRARGRSGDKGTLEPYRMFTSRASTVCCCARTTRTFATAAGHRLGLVSRERSRRVERRRAQVDAEMRRLEGTRLHGTPHSSCLRRRRLATRICAASTRRRWPTAGGSPGRGGREVRGLHPPDARRGGRASSAWKGMGSRRPRLRRGARPLDRDSRAAAQVRPRSLGQASRIPGVTPAAISILTVCATRHDRWRPLTIREPYRNTANDLDRRDPFVHRDVHDRRRQIHGNPAGSGASAGRGSSRDK